MFKKTGFLYRYFFKLAGRIPLLVLMVIIAIFLTGYVVHQVIYDQEVAADLRVFEFLSAYITPGLTAAMEAITYCASKNFLQVAYGLVILVYLFQKKWKRAGEILIIGLGGFLINLFMKLSFKRPRPSDPLIDPLTNFSFPSGHATSGFIFYGLLAYLVWKSDLPRFYKYTVITVLILFSLVIGFSRIYLRMHYASDVVAGFAVGFSWLVLCIWIMEAMKRKAEAELRDLVRASKKR